MHESGVCLLLEIYNLHAFVILHLHACNLHAGIMTPSLDVYSFGILMWEVYCAQAVFEVRYDDDAASYEPLPPFPSPSFSGIPPHLSPLTRLILHTRG